MIHENHVRETRIAARKSQTRCAAEAGLALATLNRIEQGWTVPTRPTAEKIARTLSVTVEHLFPGVTLKPGNVERDA